MTDWNTLLDGVRVIPVLIVDRLEDAAPLAETLFGAGLGTLEVTLRTPCATDAIAAMTRAAPEARIGAGTILHTAQWDAVKKAGACFGVSPGHTETLLNAAEAAELPYLAGAQTVSEIMALGERGLKLLKFFPAARIGGPGMLKTLASVLPDIAFCPTGGITAENVADYLALPNVACVGGTWIAPPELVNTQNWPEIAKRARHAAGL
ncbi:bifunctional 4-hydroxy-2-oxoglutarate aldolase/2-dehydro-3-deoxy-phosphogluconate aldolase [Varunaivibrio sulfuroxidans]|uniref:2-dehydro-3-deoxy-phosphogluconate aldolase n=1 Tax=Varunaivibrio sulfuroxidans TaxID=1773489 RepID=A0A4R3J6F3_9PROT|nr:bifunctional 4-hydroxy-2-oxoglutarate aldolase/2-dehydro-3-deoxy-phosphogluconate aldolase [Varunaivibrio sulfuroxidans]TCS60942.1 2-dehydro-3-deoxyphosphogluconate aldolase/(4S)-4-hydroxy-2-oxoglutarate aldolase [Varunaivibrio sulfuroxidans]WES31650.1 bifunctional 4-hydroxy-2-oxoglutarate aldolase/2-dehydro-3-deoxy-phosphogluconate aldolase [Varunaivibrio sulfuroxidans]